MISQISLPAVILLFALSFKALGINMPTKNLINTAVENNKASTLHYKVFTVKRPGVNRDPKMPAGHDDLKWVVNTATLIYGEKDAVLVDCFLTVDQTQTLVDSIIASGKNLTTIYITHAHGDHFFGLALLLKHFPNAIAVSTQGVVDASPDLIKPAIVESFWKTRFPGQIPDTLVIPQVMKGKEIVLEGNKLIPQETNFTDTRSSTCLYVPSIGLIVTGDAVYNGIHPFLSETTPETRKQWVAAIDHLMSLHPKAVVTGHKNPAIGDDPKCMQETKSYLLDFERINKETTSDTDLYNRMIALYPSFANPGSLWGGATAAKK